MKQRFFIFVQCAPGKRHEAGLAIAKSGIDGIVEINSVSGKWDILLRVEVDNREDVSTVSSRAVVAALVASCWRTFSSVAICSLSEAICAR